MKIKDLKLGATGQFPRGKARDDDQGELRMAIAADHENGIIQLVFGQEVAWLGLDVGTARSLATTLLEKADEIERREV